MHEFFNYLLGQTSDTVGEYDLLAVRFNRNKLIRCHGTAYVMGNSLHLNTTRSVEANTGKNNSVLMQGNEYNCTMRDSLWFTGIGSCEVSMLFKC